MGPTRCQLRYRHLISDLRQHPVLNVRIYLISLSDRCRLTKRVGTVLVVGDDWNLGRYRWSTDRDVATADRLGRASNVTVMESSTQSCAGQMHS